MKESLQIRFPPFINKIWLCCKLGFHQILDIWDFRALSKPGIVYYAKNKGWRAEYCWRGIFFWRACFRNQILCSGVVYIFFWKSVIREYRKYVHDSLYIVLFLNVAFSTACKTIFRRIYILFEASCNEVSGIFNISLLTSQIGNQLKPICKLHFC